MRSGRKGADLDRTCLHRIKHCEGWHDLAGREDLNLELVVGDLGDAFGKHLAAAIRCIERFRPTGGELPFDIRH